MAPTADDIATQNELTTDRLTAGIPESEDDWLELPYRGFHTVRLGDAPAFVMFSNNDCGIVRSLLRDGVYEPMAMAVWLKRVADAQLVIDLGANTGIYSLAAAAANQGCYVVAFEPLVDAFHRLKLNANANSMGRIGAFSYAITDHDGKVTMIRRRRPIPFINVGAHIGGMPGKDHDSFGAMGRRLDGLIQTRHLTGRVVLKIGVEGAEAAVIDGANEFVTGFRPDILIEVMSAKRRAQVAERLKPLGYRFFHLSESEGRVTAEDALTEDPTLREDMNWFATVEPDGVCDTTPIVPVGAGD